MLNEYQVLGADTFVARMDESFKTTNFGEDSDQNEWAKTTTRIPGEDQLTLNSRVMGAYEKFSGQPVGQIHLNPHHRKIMFQRLSLCLRADLQDKERGRVNQELWLRAVTYADEEIEYAGEGSKPWSSERILKRFVIPEETARATVKAQNDEERETERDGARHANPNPRNRPRNDPRHSQAGAVMAATNYNEGWVSEQESPQLVSAVPMAPYPAPSTTRGPSREPAPAHQREPPPARYRPHELTPEEFRIKRWGRDCGPPAGPDSCLFCANRPLEHRSMDEIQRRQSGSGRGNHQPMTCQVARRYLCEGGDNESRNSAADLQKCIVIRLPDGNQNRGAEQPRDGGAGPHRV